MQKARYTRSLDLVALAFREFNRGNTTNASKLFAAAATHPSASYATRVIEATNRAATKTRVSASRNRRVMAELEDEVFEETDDDTLEVLESLAEDEEDEEEMDIEGEFDDEDDLDADEDDIDDIVEGRARARAFASAVKRMSRRR